jgi:hypothetical protein
MPLGSAALTAGTATFSISNLSIGPHSITATYGGDSDFITDTSAPVSETVVVVTANFGTQTILATSAQVSSVGQPVTLTVTVKPSGGLSGTPTGDVTFMDGTISLGTLPLRKGKVKFTTSNLPIGHDPIQVLYYGDQHFASSASPVLVETIGQTATKTKASSSRKSSAFGQAVTFTASVSTTGKARAVPTGSVAFLDGSTILGTVPLSGGKASFRTSLLSVGTHSIGVVYNGNASFAPSSASLRQTVKQSKPSIATALATLAEYGV